MKKRNRLAGGIDISILLVNCVGLIPMVPGIQITGSRFHVGNLMFRPGLIHLDSVAYNSLESIGLAT